MRKGYIDAYLPQYGGRSTQSSYSGVFAPFGIHREINLPGESMDPAGAFPMVAITNNMVKGTVNFRTPIMENVKAGNNVPMYFASTVGLWEGAKIASERIDGKNEVITVKKILWDGQKKQNYILTDVTRPYPAGSMFTNKSITPGLNMAVNSNSDNHNQLQLCRRLYCWGACRGTCHYDRPCHRNNCRDVKTDRGTKRGEACIESTAP